MTRSSSLAIGAVLSLLAGGCAGDLGLGAGATIKDAHAVGVARAAGSTRILGAEDYGFLLGGSLENRMEMDRGSRWNMGVLAGWGYGPAALGGRMGWELFGEAGIPVRQHLLRDSDYYLGAAAALPISLERTRSLHELNNNTWILRRRVELVPQLRGRFYHEGDDAPRYEGESRPAPANRFEAAFLVSFRIRVKTDLF